MWRGAHIECDAQTIRIAYMHRTPSRSERIGLREELLNEALFRSLAHARAALEVWRTDCNTAKPRPK
jgi:hypothetical protein